MRVGAETPAYESIVFDSETAFAEDFLDKYTAALKNQVVESFLISSIRNGPMFFQAGGSAAQVSAAETATDNSTDNSYFNDSPQQVPAVCFSVVISRSISSEIS